MQSDTSNASLIFKRWVDDLTFFGPEIIMGIVENNMEPSLSIMIYTSADTLYIFFYLLHRHLYNLSIWCDQIDLYAHKPIIPGWQQAV